MAAVPSKDTKPELALRRALHKRGLRFRTHTRDIVGRPDIANRRRKIAIFVDGDFWHANPACWQRRGMDSMGELFPDAKRDYWMTKLQRNVVRDAEVNSQLARDGWQVIRVWESELRADLDLVVSSVASAWCSA